MDSCYRFEQLDYSNGLLNLDATYIIHLEGNGRLEQIKSQLNEFHPTNLVYILYNKGYKKCNKSLHLNEPQIDLIDAFIYIFKDALHKNYQNILILEDDFIFNKKITNPKIQKNVMDFVTEKSKKNEAFVYLLGCLPFLQRSYDANTNILVSGIGTHACIYSRKCIEDTLKGDQTKFKDWDYYTYFNYTKYMYHEPLCYQLFPETENQKNWDSFFGLKYILIWLIKLLKLDVEVEPGYTFFYNLSKALFTVGVFCIIFLIIFLIYYGYSISTIQKIQIIKKYK